MKLRSKKTGTILEQAVIKSYACGAGYRLMVCNNPYSDIGQHYDTLAELNEDWEDYKPKEPLIKDEKIRKAVRAWAEINDIEQAGYKLDDGISDCESYLFDSHNTEIEFGLKVKLEELEDDELHTIAELCGEEE